MSKAEESPFFPIVYPSDGMQGIPLSDAAELYEQRVQACLRQRDDNPRNNLMAAYFTERIQRYFPDAVYIQVAIGEDGYYSRPPTGTEIKFLVPNTGFNAQQMIPLLEEWEKELGLNGCNTRTGEITCKMWESAPTRLGQVDGYSQFEIFLSPDPEKLFEKVAVCKTKRDWGIDSSSARSRY